MKTAKREVASLAKVISDHADRLGPTEFPDEMTETAEYLYTMGCKHALIAALKILDGMTSDEAATAMSEAFSEGHEP